MSAALLRRSASILAVLLIIALIPATASAHERREVLDGRVRMTTGFLNEPTVETQMNAVYLNVVSLTEKHAAGQEEPTEGLEKTVKVEVAKGGGAQKGTMDLEPRSGQPGQSVAPFMPSQAGDYSFRFFGKINGQQVNETFESGPGRFSAAGPLSEVQFPEVAEPRDLSGRIDAARNIGIAGLVAGVLGIALGLYAATRRSSAATPTSSATGVHSGD